MLELKKTNTEELYREHDIWPPTTTVQKSCKGTEVQSLGPIGLRCFLPVGVFVDLTRPQF